jgi:multidrug efflux pump subunit AcrA (membrane-fusion protein)
VLDAKSALDLASAASDEARATQAFTRLTSPIRGTVSFRDLRFGENAVPGRRAFQVVDLDRLRVVVSLPEKDLTRVHEGQTAVMRPSYAPELAVPARVVRIGPVIDPASGTFRVTLQPEGPSLRPGQFVTVSIEQERRENVLVLPRRVLVWDEGEPFVFRVEEAPPETPEEARKREEKEEKQGKKEKNKGFFFSFGKGGEKEGGSKPPEIPGPRRVAHKVPVRLGFLEADRVEVLEEASPATDALRRPLAEGELVVKVGQETLREGSRIRLPEDPVWKPEEDEKTPDEGASDAK